jgi:hypothetical protein
MIGDRLAISLFSYTPEFALQMRKSTEYLSKEAE